jgi:hypothetical protein
MKLLLLTVLLVASTRSVAAFSGGRSPRSAYSSISSNQCAFFAPPVIGCRRRSSNNVLKAASVDPDPAPEPKLDWGKIGNQTKVFWEMSVPYFEESKAGRWLFAGMIGITILNSGVSVVFSYLGKDFWNALSAKNTVEFYSVLGKYVGALLCEYRIFMTVCACSEANCSI